MSGSALCDEAEDFSLVLDLLEVFCGFEGVFPSTISFCLFKNCLISRICQLLVSFSILSAMTLERRS